MSKKLTTPEQDDFLREFIPGHYYHEIRQAFKEKYGIELTKSQIGNACERLNVRCGVQGSSCFKKGNIPANKGKKEDEYMSKEAIEKASKTRFKKGMKPHNALPIGTESERDGFIYVKVCDGKGNKNWKPKQVLIWEREHGQLPDRHVVAFADGNNRNFNIDNLVAVPKKVWGAIQVNEIPYYDKASLEVAMKVAELKSTAFHIKEKNHG